MDITYIGDLRTKLERRIETLYSIQGASPFHAELRRFWHFVNNQAILVGIMEELALRCPSMEIDVLEMSSLIRIPEPDTELELAARGFFTVKQCAEFEDRVLENIVGGSFNRQDQLGGFRQAFLGPLYRYLDEQIGDQSIILALLRRYKHKCEWFQSEKLYSLWEENTQKGEKKLALHLYEYLHDQGVDFAIEPSSAVGEADMVATQNADDPLIADAKIFNPAKSKGKNYIAKGFNQIYTYTLTYNEAVGYLIIFNTSEKDLQIALSGQQQSIPFIAHNNKTIFTLVIDIYPHHLSASKRGILETIEINQQELIQVVEQQSEES